LADRKAKDPDPDEPELVPSDADELTHHELLWLYRDSEENIRFAKLMQWRMTGGAIAIFVVLALLAPAQRSGALTGVLTILVCVIAAASLCMLVIMQSWQGTERAKIRLILGKLSSLSRQVYDTKAQLNADIERYVLLVFMSGAVLTASFLILSRMLRWFA